ncbi:hypothetical protein GCM10022227_09700 [Streptomyces sedi]
MGNSTAGSVRWANAVLQSTEPPAVWTRASAASSSAGSGRSRRSVAKQRASPVSEARASAVRVLSGPTSTKVAMPAFSSVVTPSPKRTASRTCRTQYSGSHTSSAVASAPVTFETSATRGGA